MFVENKRLLSEAKLELKKSKRKDYYKILGVNKQANEDEIKKAYRKRALLHHPGRRRYHGGISYGRILTTFSPDTAEYPPLSFIILSCVNMYHKTAQQSQFNICPW